MKLVKERSGHAIGSRLGIGPRIWQARFYEHALRTVREYQGAVTYIHLNPVARGLVAKVEDWPWSSIHSHGGQGPARIGIDRVYLPSNPNVKLL